MANPSAIFLEKRKIGAKTPVFSGLYPFTVSNSEVDEAIVVIPTV